MPQSSEASEEGVAFSVRATKSKPRKLARPLAIALGVVVCEVLARLVDHVDLFLRARAADAWFGLYLPWPVLVVHTSMLAWLLCAAAAIVLTWRTSDPTAALVTAVLVAPLGFGTVRDVVRRRTATPIPHVLTLTPACLRATSGDLVVDGRRFDISKGERVTLAAARLRWDDATRSIVIYVAPDEEQALARQTAMLVRRTGVQCNYDALAIDGAVVRVPTMEAPLLLGAFALRDSDETRLHELMGRLTRP